ncbi:MAG TPA: YbaB/EbfC family nucleoid-associated protein [Actinophytocola sp.]|jgi:hypothetical protein|uniref:YbaB/EbfC family nucleoid-associated protein n=1 Tax=Actinophytocola sp. TaxID=1872138 RepID=UPI002DF96DE1|nr:YbaB/EbfC family nucleoid-associated protein [Actinophytocola sp.]
MSEYQDHLDTEISRADRRIRDTGARVSAQLRSNGPVTGRASLPNGAITVTVRPGGALVDIEIQTSALSMHPEQLAAELVKLARQATRTAGAKLHQTIRPVVSREVADSLTSLGIPPGAPADEFVDWVEVLRRQR